MLRNICDLKNMSLGYSIDHCLVLKITVSALFFVNVFLSVCRSFFLFLSISLSACLSFLSVCPYVFLSDYCLNAQYSHYFALTHPPSYFSSFLSLYPVYLSPPPPPPPLSFSLSLSLSQSINLSKHIIKYHI